jgi:hypothetical protein
MLSRGFELLHVEPEFTDSSSGRIFQVNGLFLKTPVSQRVSSRNQRIPVSSDGGIIGSVKPRYCENVRFNSVSVCGCGLAQ